MQSTHDHDILIVSSPAWKDYELLDSGNGQKLERFGTHILIRPEAEAIWKPSLADQEWHKAAAVFQPAPEENGGHWQFRKSLPEEWKLSYASLSCLVRLSSSRHVGIFPEQASQWDFIREASLSRPDTRVLNLFGYTGLATLAAAAGGAQVTHVDASRKAITWARQNQALSGLESRPIRWIVDDALKFVQREARRGAQYDGIILDPPKFGRGPKGEVWEFYALLPILLDACRQVLSPKPLFILLTAYAVKASSLTLGTALTSLMQGFTGVTRRGELVLKETSAGREISTAVFALWSESGFEFPMYSM
jgi:23S rRNA (cytosine1962-C5)-methyltransferase